MPYKDFVPESKSRHADSYELGIAALEKEIERFTVLRDQADELGRVAYQKEIDKARGQIAQVEEQVQGLPE